MEAQRPGMWCCLIYTSGTTGNPKGVMLSHDNLIFYSTMVSEDLNKNLTYENNLQPEDMHILSYMPLSHIAGLQTDLTGVMFAGSKVFVTKSDAL